MWTAEIVLVCALNMLGRSERSFPPIEFVRTAPIEVSRGAEAYVRRDQNRIYLVTSSANFRRAQESMDRCGDVMAIRKVASVLIHEEVHLKQGASEKSAYEAQLTTLTMLGAGPGTPPYQQVRAALLQTMKQDRRKPAPTGLLASAVP